ncbi:Small GTP-binding protein domain [Trinorchestia longiramus]|nr:Small GTP-binding protein domain [Trinorchestia longiramus]
MFAKVRTSHLQHKEDSMLATVKGCGGRGVQLMLWDTAGQEEFAAVTRAYYRGASCCIVAFSSCDEHSLTAVPAWKLKVEQECGQIPTVLVQTKVDLLGLTTNVDQSAVEKLAGEMGLKLFRTSALEDHNVEPVFLHLAERHLELISRSCPVVTPLTKDMFGAADKLRRGDTIVLRSKKNGKFKFSVSRPSCWIV